MLPTSVGFKNQFRNLRRVWWDTYDYVRFASGHFRGVYKTFAEAEAAAPHNKKIGYNNVELSLDYRTTLNVDLDCTDYPVLFHLSSILRKKDSGTILDFGGNIGVHYLRYRKHLDLDNINWIVCDVPEITNVGRKLCAIYPNIKFVNAVSDVRNIALDVFLAVGSMQYVRSANDVLRDLSFNIRSGHILIDQLPLYDGAEFVTLQNGGIVYYPQYVFNRKEYIANVEKLGFSLLDTWQDRLDSCVIPFHPERSIHAYSGLYFSNGYH